MSEHTDKLYVIVSARMGGAVTRDPAKAAYSAITTQPADVVVIDIKAGEWGLLQRRRCAARRQRNRGSSIGGAWPRLPASHRMTQLRE